MSECYLAEGRELGSNLLHFQCSRLLGLPMVLSDAELSFHDIEQ